MNIHALSRDRLDATKHRYASQGYVVQWNAMAIQIIIVVLGTDWWDNQNLGDSQHFLSRDNSSRVKGDAYDPIACRGVR